MIFKSEATKTFINVDEIILFQYRYTIELLETKDPPRSKCFVSYANISFKNVGNVSLELPQEEMDQLWKMISDNKTHR